MDFIHILLAIIAVAAFLAYFKLEQIRYFVSLTDEEKKNFQEEQAKENFKAWFKTRKAWKDRPKKERIVIVILWTYGIAVLLLTLIDLVK